MKSIRRTFAWLAGYLLVVAIASAQQTDVRGSKDHPRMSRFKGSVITEYKTSDFGLLELALSNPDQTMKVDTAEGRLVSIRYAIPKGHDSHEVLRSYEMALQQAGFVTLWKCVGPGPCEWFFYNPREYGIQMSASEFLSSDITYLVARRPGGEAYVMLFTWGTQALLKVMEVAPLKGGLLTAKDMARDIASTGRTAIYGVYFDTDRAEIKPESEAALKEMAKLLAQNASLNVFIVGHTDNVGPLAHNLDLAQRRAQAVVAALTTQYGVAGRRLEARGVGPLAPVAPNKTEDGRARNRRVELVER